MAGCRFLVAIKKSHKAHESLNSKGKERIRALIMNALGILPVSRSVYIITMYVVSFTI